MPTVTCSGRRPFRSMMMRLAVLAPMPGAERMRSNVAVGDGLPDGVAGQAGQQRQRSLRPDAGDADEQMKESQLVGGGKAVEGDVAFARLEVGVERHLSARDAQRVAGVTGDLHEQPQTGAVDANGDAIRARRLRRRPRCGRRRSLRRRSFREGPRARV